MTNGSSGHDSTQSCTTVEVAGRGGQIVALVCCCEEACRVRPDTAGTLCEPNQ